MKNDDRQIEEMVKQWFTKTARYEWKRLQQDPYHQIEFIVSTYFLEKYLPKHGLVLDAGGGPGRYTIELAKRGYEVVLLDLVKEMLKLAKRKIKRAGVLRKVKQFVHGSVEDLSMFTDETFDAVLCLGAPLCHLLDTKQREKAAMELVRVAKRDAPYSRQYLSSSPMKCNMQNIIGRLVIMCRVCKEKVLLRHIGSCQRNCMNFLRNKT